MTCDECNNWTLLNDTEEYWGICGINYKETRSGESCDYWMRKEEDWIPNEERFEIEVLKLREDYNRMKDTLLYIAEHSREELTVLMAINAVMVGK